MPEKGMRKCIFAAAAAVAVLLSDIGGTAVYAGENVPYETYNYDYYEEMQRAFYNFIDKFKVKLVSYQDFYGNAIGNCKYDLDYIMRDLLNED